MLKMALLACLFTPPFSLVAAGEYDYLEEARRGDPELRREAEHWMLRGSALIRKIDRLIKEWQGEKSRDLERESYALALSDLDEYLRQENELLKQALSDCFRAGVAGASCPTAATHRARIEKIELQQQKLQSILQGN